MASYHFSAQIIKRSKGHSSVAAAAYRAGARLKDERTGVTHEYDKRRGVVHTEIMLPFGAAKWLGERDKLWNHVEQIETRKDAQLAREINLALPHELDAEDRLELVRDFVRANFTSLGMVADFAIHQPVPEKGDNPNNHHAHIMLTLRGATNKGLWRVKTREWNSDDLMTEWRSSWADMQNRWLEYRGWDHTVRVDHRTLKAQRQSAQDRGDRVGAIVLDREPEIHIGPRARAAERNKRTPLSQERTVRSRTNRKRVGNYPKHDLGTRIAYTVGRIERNLARLDRKIERFARKAMRFRLRRRWLDKEEFEYRQWMRKTEREYDWQLQRKAWEKGRPKRLAKWKREQQNKRTARALLGLNPLEGAPAKYQWSPHKKQRQVVASRIIGDIDQILAALTGTRTQALKRKRSLLDHGLLRSRGKSRSGGRVRRPIPGSKSQSGPFSTGKP